MKKMLAMACLVTFLGVTAPAQEKIQYQLCGQNFMPIGMRQNLPEDAAYIDRRASPEARAQDVIKRLTFQEKLMLTGGWNNMYFPAVERLGLPPIYFADASQGINLRNSDSDFATSGVCIRVEKSTAFPSTLALAATWNTDLAYSYAQSISEECKAWGINVLLGPGLNMYRNAAGGRNFEYMGEDPFLTSSMSVRYVKGLQSLGTIATVKHFIGNEQELARHVINIKISERALREIFLPPFEASIKEAGALAVMTGNNQVNGIPGAANKPLTGDVLRREYGFKGIVMSDWANSSMWPERHHLELTSGHSLLMSKNDLFANYIQQEAKEHPRKKAELEKQLEEMVFYNLYAFFKSGVYDRAYRDPSLLKKFENHKKIARQTAEESITLLKNQDEILPVLPDKVKKIVVLGTEEALTVATGKGSGSVEGYDHIDYLSGLKKVYGTRVIHGPNISDGEISSADVVFYFINKAGSEGLDIDFNLPQVDDLVSGYAKLNPHLVVIYSGGNGMAMPWLAKTKGLIFAHLLGQERGWALANIISGKVNPSGKLPFTIEKDFNDSPARDFNKMSDGKLYWLGRGKDSRDMRVKFGELELPYHEGVYVGYRWYEKKRIEPQFPFGFGLSYTTFAYTNMHSSSKRITKEKPISVSFTVTNTGAVAGAEAAQVYVTDVESTVDRPVKELKGFSKVFLKAGESKKVDLRINWQDLAYWSEKEHQWKVEPGTFIIGAGSSSKNIQQKITVSY